MRFTDKVCLVTGGGFGHRQSCVQAIRSGGRKGGGGRFERRARKSDGPGNPQAQRAKPSSRNATSAIRTR